MAMINPSAYEFDSIFNVMDFVKPLIIEGYSVAINTVYKEYPRENDIDKFTVDIGKKGCRMAIYDPDEKDAIITNNICSIMNEELSNNIFNAMINMEISDNVKAETFNGCKNIKNQDVYKVRFHRGGLKDSMETYFEPKDWNDFISHCVEEDRDIIIDSIKCELYDDEPDTRIGWDKTWMITAKFPYDKKHDYPIGFSDRNIMELKR